MGEIFPENGLLCITSFANRKESLPLYTHLHAIESTLRFERNYFTISLDKVNLKLFVDVNLDYQIKMIYTRNIIDKLFFCFGYNNEPKIIINTQTKVFESYDNVLRALMRKNLFN